MRKTPTVFASLSLALILASCGGSNTPGVTTPGAAGPLVKVDVAALGGLRPQGLTGDAGPLLFKVNVRDSQNQLVAFNGTTFDPTGTGTTTLTLNISNDFQQTLLLPAGTYSFETAAKDASTSSTLLAYGPATENTATIQGNGAVVRLKFHAVFDKASSSLDFSTNTPLLFTNSTFNLKLSPKVAPVAGLSATVPTTDIGPVTYTLGNATDAVFNNAGSKIGINLTARGTAADSTLNVTASFNAWTQVDGTDTAVYGPTTIEFSKAIETNALVADTVMPTLTVNPVAGGYLATGTPLSGTALDDVMLSEIRVYDDGALVASSMISDNVTIITTDAGGNWTTTWSPTIVGSHDLSVIVADSTGNETRADQSVTVSPVAPYTLGTGSVNEVHYALTNGVPRTFKVIIPANNGSLFFALFNPASCVAMSGCSPQGPKQFTSSMVDAQGNPVALALDTYNGNDYDYTFTLPAGEYFVTITPTADSKVSLYGYTN